MITRNCGWLIQRNFNRTFRWIGAVSLVFLLIAGCSGGDTGEQRVSHEDGEGPLSSSRGSGGNFFYAPWDPRSGVTREQAESSKEWQVSFGVGVLCVNDADVERIEVESVRAHVAQEVSGVAVQWYKRQFSSGIDTSIDSQRGHAADGKSKWPGDFAEEIAGTKISQSCAKAREPGAKVTELVLVLTSNEAGAYVDGAAIDYTVDGRRFTLEIPWKWVLCGSRTTAETIGEAYCEAE